MGYSSDGATPKEQIRQILAIQPICPGAQGNKRYDIPPHHPHGPTVTDGGDLLGVSELDSLATVKKTEGINGTGLLDLSGLAEALPVPNVVKNRQQRSTSLLD